MRELKKEIEQASKWADAVFAETGEILPMWAATNAEGQHFIIPAVFPDKDKQAEMLRAFFEEKGAVRCLFISEAWSCATADTTTAQRAMDWLHEGKTLENFPDRMEVLIFSGEDERGMLSAHRQIIRGEGKPTLGPLEWFDTAESGGRFVGMLPHRKETAH